MLRERIGITCAFEKIKTFCNEHMRNTITASDYVTSIPRLKEKITKMNFGNVKYAFIDNKKEKTKSTWWGSYQETNVEVRLKRAFNWEYIYQQPEHTIDKIIAKPDRIIKEVSFGNHTYGPVVLEIKCPYNGKIYDAPLLEWYIQIQLEMAYMNIHHSILAVWTPYGVVLTHIEFNEAVNTTLLSILRSHGFTRHQVEMISCSCIRDSKEIFACNLLEKKLLSSDFTVDVNDDFYYTLSH